MQQAGWSLSRRLLRAGKSSRLPSSGPEGTGPQEDESRNRGYRQKELWVLALVIIGAYALYGGYLGSPSLPSAVPERIALVIR